MDEHQTPPSPEPAHAAPAPAPAPANNTTLWAVLAYIGPLIILSYIFGNHDSFVKYHIKQGLVLFVINVIVWAVSGMLFYGLWPLFHLVKLATFVLAIIGIYNVAKHQEKELPLVGSFAKEFNI